MQNVKFTNIEACLSYLPEDQLTIVNQLRDLVYTTLPNINEKLSFNVPFFNKYKTICYIWPGAVSWGKYTKEGVEFGFIHGNLLEDPTQYLTQGKRLMVCNRRLLSPADIKESVIRDLLLEAAEIDEIMEMEKNQRRRKKINPKN